MHGLISVVFSSATICKLQYGENCCGVICCIWLNEIFRSTKSGRTPKFGTDDKWQLAKLSFFNGAITGFFKCCNEFCVLWYGMEKKITIKWSSEDESDIYLKLLINIGQTVATVIHVPEIRQLEQFQWDYRYCVHWQVNNLLRA